MNSCATVWRGRGQRSAAKEGIYTTYNIDEEDEIDDELDHYQNQSQPGGRHAWIAKQPRHNTTMNNDEEFDQEDNPKCFAEHISDDNDGNDEATFDRRESDAP